MRKRIPADDFIDDLPLRVTEDSPEIDNKYFRVRRSLIAPVLIGLSTVSCIAGIISSAGYQRDDMKPSEREVQVEVTVTDTRYVLPEQCRRAMRLMVELMESNRKVLAIGPEQLDIMSKSHQAIAERDWTTLNKLGQEQRDLQNRIAEPADEALQGYGLVVQATKECEDAT